MRRRVSEISRGEAVNTFDLNTIEGRALARAAGLCVPPEADGSAPTVAAPDDSGESEKEFQARVVALAKSKGWRCYHTFDSRRSDEGYPDLTMVRGERLIFAELKVKGRKLTKAQIAWLNDLIFAAEAYLWTPGMWDTIVKTLE